MTAKPSTNGKHNTISEKAVFKYVDNQHFWFDVNGQSLEVYWWDMREADFSAEEELEQLLHKADCFTFHKADGSVVMEGW